MQSRFLRRFTAVVLALFITGFAFGIETSDLNRITFKNDTGYDILYLFFSPGDSDLWGADILGTTRTLDDGEVLIRYGQDKIYGGTVSQLHIEVFQISDTVGRGYGTGGVFNA